MFKVYGSDICIDCRNYKAVQRSRNFEAEFIDITEKIENLKEFISIRDRDPLFEAAKENKGVGIPFFVNEDGRETLDMNEALAWIGQPAVREDEIVEHRQ